MICPFTDDVQIAEDFKKDFLEKNSIKQNSSWVYQVFVYPSNAVLSSRIDDLVFVYLTNIDKVSKLKREKCVSDDPDDFWPPYPWPHKYVTVQNSAYNQFASDSENTVNHEFYLMHCLDENCTSSVKSGTFSSGTAPNVECMVYDPSFFEGVSQGCNPMVETNPNALDSIIVDLLPEAPFSFHMSEILRLNFDYAAMEEIPFPPFPHDEDPSFGPIMNFSHSNILTDPPHPLPISPIDHLFSGLVAVMYDSARGIPQKLDFSAARYNEMSDDPQHVLSSRVVMRQNCDKAGCWMQPANRIAALASSVVQNSFQNAITGALKKETFEGILIQPDEVISGDMAVLEISFASSSTLVLTPVISATILSVISLIFSTSVSLWGIQEVVKLKLILVWSKLKPFWKKHLCKVLVPKFHQNTHSHSILILDLSAATGSTRRATQSISNKRECLVRYPLSHYLLFTSFFVFVPINLFVQTTCLSLLVARINSWLRPRQNQVLIYQVQLRQESKSNAADLLKRASVIARGRSDFSSEPASIPLYSRGVLRWGPPSIVWGVL
jgi:hypothetical protein